MHPRACPPQQPRPLCPRRPLPPPTQVQHRCHCSVPGECRELEAMVTKAAKEGKVPPFPPPRQAQMEALVVDDW